MSNDGRKALWAEVLSVAIADAFEGKRNGEGSNTIQISTIKAARRYITVPNKDFRTVCELAGLDPEWMQEQLRPMVEAAQTPEETIASPSKRLMMITYNGRTKTINEWSAETGISSDTIRQRLAKGWSDERALTYQGRARRGVVSNSGESLGTGGGRSAQEASNLSFSKKEVNA